jgi:hypothetical protein
MFYVLQWLQRADGPAVGREQHPVSEKRMSLAPKHVAAQHVVAHAARTNGTGARSDRPFFDRRHSQMG